MKKRLAGYIVFFAIWRMLAPGISAQTITSSDTMKTFKMHATYYSDRFIGRRTSCGEIFRQDRYTAAHHTLKFGTLLLVTNPTNGSQVIVRINDRCPKSNILDLTSKAAKQIGVKSHSVQVMVLPGRFYPLWESQEHLTEVLKEGKLLEYSASQMTVQNVESNDEGKLYDIELFRCEKRGDAKNRIKHMPIHYQANVSYVYADASGGLKAILELSVQKKEAEAVRKELEQMFPDAKIVVSK